MMERRLLVGMAGIVLAVLSALVLQVTADMQGQHRLDAAYGGRR